jgi:hypothetical protein
LIVRHLVETNLAINHHSCHRKPSIELEPSHIFKMPGMTWDRKSKCNDL